MPREVLAAKLKEGEIISKEDDDGIVVLKWRDTRDVRLLFTKLPPTMVPVERRCKNRIQPEEKQAGEEQVEEGQRHETEEERDQTEGERHQARRQRSSRVKEKPMAVIAYNKGKGGIDLSDQMTSYGSISRKGVKWYRKLAIELLLGMSVVNAWVIHKEITKKTYR